MPTKRSSYPNEFMKWPSDDRGRDDETIADGHTTRKPAARAKCSTALRSSSSSHLSGLSHSHSHGHSRGSSHGSIGEQNIANARKVSSQGRWGRGTGQGGATPPPGQVYDCN